MTRTPSAAMIQKVRDACALVDAAADQQLDLSTLARKVGCSPFHLQRSFKLITGVTPKRYHEARRLQALKSGLRSGVSVTTAIVAAGFGSSSRLYEKLDTRLGMTPSQYRTSGRGLCISYITLSTVHGRLLIAATDRGLCAVQFGAEDGNLVARLQEEFSAANLLRARAGTQLSAWVASLQRHLRKPNEQLALPLDVRGTSFQMLVWAYLQTIPVGETRSYQQVAVAIGSPRGARAVARACAANQIAIAVPCHRVLRANGDTGGYRWGEARKGALLEAEALATLRSRAVKNVPASTPPAVRAR
jgi:AraC family transcriptional regulator, regulatory protein of adaptative response / methylated-DNA-[protein]-cysteine methyltransferase